ncbi:hypothetical protein [Legionella drancourtii]|uniref:Uncharacterized protein n=1 Tax=Legionella drancourtii LLAP12 TaxID=658187 RepID=G9EKG1_9GAMM|nr:hypothetical protein [Legionella drancourtii]EHL32312.1 hypothetical protein LDG_5693 [Legionella drancourtii LLAP12]
MKHEVTTFKSLKACIKELERFIRNGNHLETGREFQKFGNLRSREVLGCWLLAAVLNHEAKSEDIKICTDPLGSDGILFDTKKNISHPLEQVMIARCNPSDKKTEELILELIHKKQNKGGKSYASGKTLVVFLNRKGDSWYPNRLTKILPQLDFNAVWVVGLQEMVNDSYSYNVTQLSRGGCPIWRINIKNTFDDWIIKKIQ